jgi:hypothetical protein
MCVAYLVRKGFRPEEVQRVFSPYSFAHLSMNVRRFTAATKASNAPARTPTTSDRLLGIVVSLLPGV